MRIKADVRGHRELNRRLQRLADRMPQAAGTALKEEAENLMTDIKAAPDFPVQYGTLRASGFVDKPKITGSGATVDIGFGGAAAPYALFVHEGTRHMAARKYLERPVLAAQPQFPEKIARRLRSVINAA